MEIKNCPNLEAINVSDSRFLKALKISNCPNIKKIYVSNCQSLTKIEWDYLKNIVKFVVNHSPVDLYFDHNGEFSRLKKLMACNIRSFSSEFSFLESSRRLKVLDLENTRISTKNDNLRFPENLEEFYCGGTQLLIKIEKERKRKINRIYLLKKWIKYNDLINSSGSSLKKIRKTLRFIEKKAEKIQEQILNRSSEIEERKAKIKKMLRKKEEFVKLLEEATKGFIKKINIDTFDEKMVCSEDTWEKEKGTDVLQKLLEEKVNGNSVWKKWAKKNLPEVKKTRSLVSIYEEIAQIIWKIKKHEEKLFFCLEDLRKLEEIKELKKMIAFKLITKLNEEKKVFQNQNLYAFQVVQIKTN